MAAVADAMPQQQPNMAATTSGGSTSQGGAGAASNAAGTSGAAPQAFPAAQPQKPSNVASLYVGDLQKDVTEAQLYELFSKIGNVISIRVCRDMITRRSLGYAYVNFQNAPDAEKAMDSLNFEPLRSKPIRIMWSHRDPSLRRSGVGNIFIRNLHKAIDNKALYDTFSAFGNILSCKIVTDENSDSKGYGFVHFETEEAANRAIDKINGMQLDAQVVFVGKFVPKNEREKTFTNCYVKNLPDNVKDQELRDLFKAYGDITNATVMVDDNGKSRGFGFVSFTKHEAAERAVQATNGKDVNGKILYVARAQKKGERQQELLRVFEQKRMEAQKQSANANLYVKNIEDGLDEERLRREFATFGGIKSCKIMKDEHGRSKGFGFISYNQPAEAQAALQHMQGRTIISKPLYVAIAQRKEERTAMIQSHVQSRMMPSPSAGGAFRLPTQPNALQAQQMAAMQAVQLASLFPYANPQMAAALQALTNNPAAAAAFAAQQGQNPRGFGFQNMPGVNMNGMRAMGPLGAQQQWQQRAAALAATAAAAAGLRGGPQAGGAGGGGGGYSLSHVAAGQQGGQYANQNAAMVAAANAAIQQQQQQAVAAAAAAQQQQQGSVQQQMTQQQLGGGGGAGGMQGQMGGGGAGGAGMMAAGGNMRNSISNMPQVTRTYGGQQQNQQQQNQQRMAPSGRPGDQQQMSAGGQYGSSQQQGGQMQQRGMAAGGQQQPGGGPPGGMRGPPPQQQQQQQQQGVRGTSVGRVPGGGQPAGAGVNGPVSGGASQQPQQQPNGIGNGQQNNGDQQSPASPKSYAGAAAQQAPAGPQPASMRQQPPRPAAGGPQANAAAAGKPAPANDIIDAAKLATMDKSMQKTVLGEKLYPKIREICPDFVGKITGMLLESMDSSDLLLMIEDSGFDFMKKKVDEAAKLLRASQKPAPGTGGATAAAAPAQPSA